MRQVSISGKLVTTELVASRSGGADLVPVVDGSRNDTRRRLTAGGLAKFGAEGRAALVHTRAASVSFQRLVASVCQPQRTITAPMIEAMIPAP
jgi:hypothetical protein